METKEEPTGSRFEQLASALQNGLIVVDARGQVVWMDEATRGSVNGGLDDLKLPLSRDESAGADCFASAVDIRIHGQPMRLCILQEVPRPEDSSYELVAAVEAVMSDSSWFTRTMVEKFKAWRQTRQPAARSSDLEVLTSREREILALICEGLSDYEMSKRLNLSQNTVRNHVASLYRKIGVNRRSAAIIWARERALTSHEFIAAKSRGGADRTRQS
jgi:DNA-binding CsgD family transcriptional regulator